MVAVARPSSFVITSINYKSIKENTPRTVFFNLGVATLNCVVIDKKNN